MAVYKRPMRARKRRAKKSIKKSDLQSVWETRIAEAEGLKQKWKEDFACDTLEKMYRGNQQPDWWEGEGWTN